MNVNVSPSPSTRRAALAIPDELDQRLIRTDRIAQITKLLEKPFYSSSAKTRRPKALPITPASPLESNVPEDFNLTMDKGLHVFSPTSSVFHDFPNFLKVVEEIAGREHGVVKVIMPKDWYE